jgi:phage terminase small subunit
MGRPHIPTAILDAKGSFIHNPQLKRPNEPKTTKPLGPAPKWLSPEEKIVWKDLAKQALPGVLMFSDRNMFELLVHMTAKFRAREHMTTSDLALMLHISSHFAMTPSDRAKVQVEQPKESKLSKFLKHNTLRRRTAASEPRTA